MRQKKTLSDEKQKYLKSVIKKKKQYDMTRKCRIWSKIDKFWAKWHANKI